MYWARDYGITGTGIDMSPLFTAQATRRAEELGVSERVHFIHNDAAGYVANEKCDVAACVGATSDCGGVAGTMDLLAKSLKPGGIMLIGEPYWRQVPATEETAQPAASRRSQTFSLCPVWLRLSINRAMTWLKWCWLIRKAGTGTKPQNG